MILLLADNATAIATAGPSSHILDILVNESGRGQRSAACQPKTHTHIFRQNKSFLWQVKHHRTKKITRPASSVLQVLHFHLIKFQE